MGNIEYGGQVPPLAELIETFQTPGIRILHLKHPMLTMVLKIKLNPVTVSVAYHDVLLPSGFGVEDVRV